MLVFVGLAHLVHLLDATTGGRVVTGDGQAQLGAVGEGDGHLHEALTVGAPTDDESAVVVLDGAGEDLAGRARHLVGEDDQRGVLAGATTVGKELLPRVSLALHIDDHLAAGNELVEHGHGRVQESAGIVA